jgi:hypothetical protein
LVAAVPWNLGVWTGSGAVFIQAELGVSST